MKLLSHKVAILLFLLMVETHCGVIDNVFGKVKNTTSALGQDVRNVWSFSKNIVGLETATEDNRPEEEKRGLIGGMLHSTREKLHKVRNYFWNTDTDTKDAGIFGNMFNRVKNRLSKIKGSIVGDNPTPPQPMSDNEKLIKNTLEKLFFGNGTRQVHGRAFQDAIDNLRRKLHEIRSNITGVNPVHHGEGLIDVRAAAVGVEEAIHENTPGVANDVYDVVDDGWNKVKDETARSYSNIKDNADNVANKVKSGVEEVANQLSTSKDKESDAIAKENELLQSQYSKINSGVQQVEDNVKSTVEDAKRLSY